MGSPLRVGIAVAALCIAVGCDKQPASSQTNAAPVAATDVASDPRVAFLLAPCEKNEHYDVDTSDPIPILIETMLHGQRDPLRRAREELAASEAGLEAVARVVNTQFSALDAAGPLRNAIDVLTRTDLPQARATLLYLLEYREDGIRVLAAEGLKKHGTPADYDAMRSLFDSIGFEFRSKVADAMHALDKVRAQQQYLTWIEHDEYPNLWPEFALKLAGATDPEVVERCRRLASKFGPRYQIPLITPAARAGDAEALEQLRKALREETPDLRRSALACAIEAGLERELVETLHKDPDPQLRALALGALSQPARIDEFKSDIATAMGDSDESVAQFALLTMAGLRDANAIERALALLDDPGSGSVANGMRALRVVMDSDPAIAQKAFERLSARRAAEEKLSFEARAPLLVAIGQVPSVAAGKALYEMSRTATGMAFETRAERWLTLQAANTTAAAQPFFRGELDRERDPLRRIDLLEALALKGGDGARTALLELLEGDTLSPYEVLYAAERLTHIGPAEIVAPVLKRATLRVQQNDARRALQCLLWMNYPGPR